ncbi:hypothetical protein Tco_0860334 [Tanacetum coccineum]|uniref:Calponin-homology (CH) domain-containing protein n=1 Tax=Tanacetum coccineum TaxID=301880 RepID=A0ABQ5BGX3_9ASTR
MTTLAEHIIVARAKNRPPMLEKSMYDSLENHIRLFIKGKKHGRLMLDSIDNGLLVIQLLKKMGKLDLRNTPNSLKHNNFKMNVMFKQQISFFTVFHPMCMHLLTIKRRLRILRIDLIVPMFKQGEDPIECINKAMTFLSAVASRFPPSNNQLRTLSNPRNQATIQDGRVTIQQIQGRQNQSYAGTGNRGIATTSKGNVAAGQPRVVKSEAQEAGQILDEEQLTFLADPVLSEVPYFDSYPNDMINQDVQEMQYFEQTHVDDFQDNEIHSGSNIILYSQYLQESQDVVIQDTNTSAPNDLLVLSLVKQITDHVAHLDKENQTNKMVNESLTAELERYKERIAIFEQRLNVDLNKREKLIDSQMDDLIQDRNAELVAF